MVLQGVLRHATQGWTNYFFSYCRRVCLSSVTSNLERNDASISPAASFSLLEIGKYLLEVGGLLFSSLRACSTQPCVFRSVEQPEARELSSGRQSAWSSLLRQGHGKIRAGGMIRKRVPEWGCRGWGRLGSCFCLFCIVYKYFVGLVYGKASSRWNVG